MAILSNVWKKRQVPFPSDKGNLWYWDLQMEAAQVAHMQTKLRGQPTLQKHLTV